MKSSRREFFTLLAAAPLVAPAVVREMAKPNLSYLSGKTVTSILDFDTGHIFQLADGERIHWPARMGTIKRFEGLPMRFAESIDAHKSTDEIPNRLYGAQINADGDAV